MCNVAAWILTLVLIHVDGVSTTAVTGFATKAECEANGRAWQSQVNKRQENSDVATYRCDAHIEETK